MNKKLINSLSTKIALSFFIIKLLLDIGLHAILNVINLEVFWNRLWKYI